MSFAAILQSCILFPYSLWIPRHNYIALYSVNGLLGSCNLVLSRNGKSYLHKQFVCRLQEKLIRLHHSIASDFSRNPPTIQELKNSKKQSGCYQGEWSGQGRVLLCVFLSRSVVVFHPPVLSARDTTPRRASKLCMLFCGSSSSSEQLDHIMRSRKRSMQDTATINNAALR